VKRNLAWKGEADGKRLKEGQSHGVTFREIEKGFKKGKTRDYQKEGGKNYQKDSKRNTHPKKLSRTSSVLSKDDTKRLGKER